MTFEAAVQVYERAVEKGIHLWLDGDRLCYQAPRGALDAEIREELRANRGNLQLFLRRRGDSAGPLSFCQEALFSDRRVEGNSSLHNSVYCTTLDRNVSPHAVRQAVGKVVERHGALRLRFHWEGERVEQYVDSAAGEPDWEEVELSDREEVAEYVRKVGETGFQLRSGPVIRARFVRCANHEPLLVVVVHRLCCDLRSFEIFARDLEAYYRELVEGVPADLPTCEIGYPEYVVWQRRLLEAGYLKATEEYWAKALDGSGELMFPADRPRPMDGSCRETWLDCGAELSVMRMLKKAVQAEGATLFEGTLAAFFVVLSRYAGKRDIVLGVHRSGRTRPEHQEIVGQFANVTLVRCELDLDANPRELIRVVRRSLGDTIRQEDYELPLFVQRLTRPQGPVRPSGFRVAYAWNRTLPKVPASGPLRLRMLPEFSRQADIPADLTLLAEEQGQGARICIRFNAELYDQATIESVCEDYRTTLRVFAGGSARRPGRLELARPARVTGPALEANSFIECVERFARERGADIALDSAEGQLSYTRLNACANQLAHELLAEGLQPGDPVAVLMRHRPLAVVALLAVWKVGGVYVPLEAAYPDSRIEGILSQVRPKSILLSQELRERGRGYSVARRVIDPWPESFRHAFREDPGLKVSGEAAAYVIFTSGTTGRPKGVSLPHRGVNNVMASQLAIFQQGRRSRVLQFFSWAFDASVFEVLLALGAGACLYVPDSKEVVPGPHLVRLLREQCITTLTITPSALAAFDDRTLPDLSCLICAGEACSSALVDAWQPGRRMYNAYGPSETTIWATTAECVAGQGAPPIGKPIANTSCYLLDHDMRPVPVGAVGELYIGGPGVGLGYLGSKGPGGFVRLPDVAGDTALYGTGDRVLLARDGNLRFLGRTDDQIKVRGHRVEIGEIEHALRQDPQCSDAAVLLRKYAEDDERLVAYVVSARNHELRIEELRHSLAQRLPGFMIPSTFVEMDELPLAASGKLDRTALAKIAPDEALPEGDAADGAQHSTCVRVARIWRDLLGVATVGLDQSFMEVGGHSLLLTKLSARLNQMTAREISVIELFEHPTIRQQARLVESRGGSTSAEQELAVAREGDDRKQA